MKGNQAIPFDERIRRLTAGSGEAPSDVRPAKECQSLPFEERMKDQAIQEGTEPLDILSLPIPAFFQGMAALTGLRCLRENMASCLRWYEMILREKRRRDQASGASSALPDFCTWLTLGVNNLFAYEEAAGLYRFLLEPMYQLEESVCHRKEF